MFEWCSIAVMTTLVAGPDVPRGRSVCATRLMRLGRAAREDDLARDPRVEEAARLGPRASS